MTQAQPGSGAPGPVPPGRASSGAPPAWLTELAVRAEEMRVPPRLRAPAQMRPALHDQQVRVSRRLTEQEQDRGGPAALRRRPQLRWHPHLPRPGRQFGEPGGRRAGTGLGRGHEKGPSLTSFLASFSSTGPMPNDGHSRAMGHAPQAGRRA